MDIQKYIASGILEQYVLGLASEADQREVERLAAQHPEIRAELEAIELALEDYARIHQLQTPAGALTKINAKIDALENNSSPPPPKSGNNWWTWLLGLALIGVGIWAWVNFQKTQEQQNQISQLNNQLTTLQEDCDEKDQLIEALRQRLQITQDPDNQQIIMDGNTGTNLAPQALAVVHYNDKNQTIHLDPQSLPTPPPDKQYQLWAIIPGDPVPKSMGVFDILPDTAAFQQLTYVAGGTTFAVTLEPRGGSVNPTLDQMYVAGTI